MNITGYTELSRTGGKKLVEIIFENPGYPVGDGSYRPTDTWELPEDRDVVEEIAAFLDETVEVVAFPDAGQMTLVTQKDLDAARAAVAQREADRVAEEERVQAEAEAARLEAEKPVEEVAP